MKRRRFTILSVLSLLVFAGSAYCWANSFHVEYYGPGFLALKWIPTHATPQWQCVWLIAGTVGITFAIIAYRSERERDRRIRLGLCRTCGYDLRTKPDRCPECGSVRGT